MFKLLKDSRLETLSIVQASISKLELGGAKKGLEPTAGENIRLTKRGIRSSVRNLGFSGALDPKLNPRTILKFPLGTGAFVT